MKLMISPLLACFFALAFLGQSTCKSAKDDCQFMKKARQQIETNPHELAKSNCENNLIVFYLVGVGEAAVLPGFKHNEELCINSTYRVEMIWVGGDVISCDGQKKLGEEVLIWAEKYNKQVKNLLLKLRKYKCNM